MLVNAGVMACTSPPSSGTETRLGSRASLPSLSIWLSESCLPRARAGAEDLDSMTWGSSGSMSFSPSAILSSSSSPFHLHHLAGDKKKTTFFLDEPPWESSATFGFCLPTCLFAAGGTYLNLFQAWSSRNRFASLCWELGFFCTPDGTEEADSGWNMSSIYVSSEGFGTITVTLDDVFRNHEVLLDLVDGLALPEFFTSVSENLFLSLR